MNLSIGEYKLPIGYTAVFEDGKIVVIEKQNYKPKTAIHSKKRFYFL